MPAQLDLPTVADVCKALGYSRASLYRFAKRGMDCPPGSPHLTIVGGYVIFHDQWAQDAYERATNPRAVEAREREIAADNARIEREQAAAAEHSREAALAARAREDAFHRGQITTDGEPATGLASRRQVTTFPEVAAR